MNEPVRFRDAVRFWLKLGFISFGGPAGQIAVMHAELVERRRWISEQRFLHALNYCMVLPGPEAQQLATYIGWLLHRTRGGIVAGALFVLPSLLILIALAWVYLAFGDVPAVAGVLYGIKPAVTAIVLHAAWRIGSRALGHPVAWAIAAAAFVAIFALRVPFPAIVAGAAVAGIVGGRVRPAWFAAKTAGHATRGPGPASPAIIDDGMPAPAHARFRWSRFATVFAAGFALWALPMALLVSAFGLDGTLVHMAWFFTKAALVTFGGAYAVLPYVTQAAVERYGWATPAQMIDGLALGETTPGPLIMVVAFVGFVGGWQSADLHAASGAGPVVAGAMAAAVVTWFTFLPSFVFILAGAPLVEATHGMEALNAPLRAITAAVVGVIVNLAVYFAWHVFWPRGAAGGVDVAALAIAAAATAALFRFRRGVVETIVACGLLGLALQLAGAVSQPDDAERSTAVPAHAVAGAGAAQPYEESRFPGATIVDTALFRIASTTTPERTREIADAVDALPRAWREATGATAAAPDRPLLRLYADRREFQAENRSQPWAEAYYLDGVAYAYYDAHGRNRLHWMLHEVVHQLNREVAGWTLPRWSNEGLATYLSASRWWDGELRGGEPDPTAYPVYWLPKLPFGGDRSADIAAGHFIPLRAVLTGEGAPPLARTVNLQYVHWWSLVHFLMHGESGRYADGFRALLRSEGTPADFERLIGPIDEVEAAWYAHLIALKAGIPRAGA